MTTSFESANPRSYLLAAVWSMSAFVFLAATVFCMLFIVPKFEKEFLEQKMAIPWGMEAVIAASRWNVKYWYIAPIVIFPTCIGLGALVAFIQPQGKVRTGFWILWLFLIGMPAAVMVSFIAWCIATIR